uniref:NADH dehydrogenase subunit 3 n=1 Tax=Afrocampsis griseosetosus TaxID=1491719 RepID=A0A0U1WEM2_9HYME|nr:NADH dehydrogenase subunit 3 [Afrocampsis griseosetosus]
MNFLFMVMLIVILISLSMVGVNYLISKKMKLILGKNYSFECGFDQFVTSS